MAEFARASSRSELRRVLRGMQLDVSPRGRGRKSGQTERFCMARLLDSLPKGRLGFPLVAEHRDRPDFLIRHPLGSIGVEVTEAVAENQARAAVIRAGGVGPRVHMLPRATPGEAPRTNAELTAEIRGGAGATPWVGDEPERQWAEAMLHFAMIKAEKAGKTGFENFERNWLLIYDNWLLPAIRHERASEMLMPMLRGSKALDVFDTVLVLGSRELCEIGELVQIHPVKL